MNKFFSLIALLLPFPAFAGATIPPPADLCAGYSCTAQMQLINSAFQQAQGFALEEVPYLATGECFHLNGGVSQDQAMYGYTFLDVKDGDAYMGGSFSFYDKENPYKDITPEIARQNTHLYYPNHRVILKEAFAYSDMNPNGEDIWRYWLRHDANHLYLYGQWGKFHRVFCQMDRK